MCWIKVEPDRNKFVFQSTCDKNWRLRRRPVSIQSRSQFPKTLSQSNRKQNRSHKPKANLRLPVQKINEFTQVKTCGNSRKWRVNYTTGLLLIWQKNYVILTLDIVCCSSTATIRFLTPNRIRFQIKRFLDTNLV